MERHGAERAERAGKSAIRSRSVRRDGTMHEPLGAGSMKP